MKRGKNYILENYPFYDNLEYSEYKMYPPKNTVYISNNSEFFDKLSSYNGVSRYIAKSNNVFDTLIHFLKIPKGLTHEDCKNVSNFILYKIGFSNNERKIIFSKERGDVLSKDETEFIQNVISREEWLKDIFSERSVHDFS